MKTTASFGLPGCILFLLFFSFCISLSAQPQEKWQWVKSSPMNPSDIAADEAGNTFCAGYFSSVIYTATDTFRSSGFLDICLIKYDANGKEAWARHIGGTSNKQGGLVTADPAGNVIVTGVFHDSITFGSKVMVSPGGQVIYFAKYDPDGNLIWANMINGGEISAQPACDAAGNIFLFGTFESNTLTIGNTTLTLQGPKNYFLAKFGQKGQVLWARSGASQLGVFARSVDTDSAGNAYVAGIFQSTMSFDTVVLQTKGVNDGFVAKFDVQGQVVWARSFGGTQYDGFYSISAGPDGRISLTGVSQSSNVQFDAYTISAKGQNDVIVLQLDTDGKVRWIRQLATPEWEDVRYVSADRTGNVFVAGWFSGDSMPCGDTVLYNTNDSGSMFRNTIYLLKYDLNGNVLRAETGITDKYVEVRGLAVDGAGNAIMSGFLSAFYIQFGNKITYTGRTFFAKFGSGLVASVKEPEKQISVLLYPNPNTGKFSIEGLDPGKWTISIHSINGACIYEGEITNGSTLDLEGAAAGLYVYRIYNEENKLGTGRLIVE
jgi:hypothetical protein